ncbi:outer membrane protein transport protein [Escherichia coli]
MRLFDQFGWGASITSNYGLATEFTVPYAAGSMAVKPICKQSTLTLAGLIALTIAWSFGLGFDAVYAKAKIERYAGSSGAIGCLGNLAVL